MGFDTISLQQHDFHFTIELNRHAARNSLNDKMLMELQKAIQSASMETECKAVVIKGNSEIFCAGMDLHELSTCCTSENTGGIKRWATNYMNLLYLMHTTPKIIIAKVDGNVLAGGVGLVAASDLVIASSKAIFRLTEILWGLLPAMVAPFLTRRTTIQSAYAMALLSRSIDAKEAQSIRLVDEVHENSDVALQQILNHFEHLSNTTLEELKRYFFGMQRITKKTCQHAVEKTVELLTRQEIQKKICAYASSRQLPWNTDQ